MLAHIQNPVVSVGDEVNEGQLLAYVGNNGYCRNSHIHIGAYRDEKPLMIGFDANKVGEISGRVMCSIPVIDGDNKITNGEGEIKCLILLLKVELYQMSRRRN